MLRNPQTTTRARRHVFSVRAKNDWNGLPHYVVLATSFDQFVSPGQALGWGILYNTVQLLIHAESTMRVGPNRPSGIQNSIFGKVL